jgi:hypothetical protein
LQVTKVSFELLASLRARLLRLVPLSKKAGYIHNKVYELK